MGGIESGLPGGGHGKFADYHENPLKGYFASVSDYFSSPSTGIGKVNVNPYSDQK